MHWRISFLLALGAIARASAAAAAGGDYLITDFGAKADEPALNTASIQACIDACAKTGGRVMVPPGTYRTGTLYLKSNVELHLARNSTLSGSTRLSDYPENQVELRSYSDRYVDRALIWADDQSNVAITGDGTIQGNGDKRFFPFDRADPYRTYRTRPYLIRFVRCRKVQIEGVTLVGAAMWMQQYLGCADLRITGITSYNHGNVNNDGLDIDSCQRVMVSDCHIDSEDDGICLKSTGLDPCEDVAISNCVVSSNCSAIKLGTESTGGFRDITISNCVVKPSACATETEGNRLGKAAIALMVVDGGTMEHILVDNISVQDVDTPLFIRLGNRGTKYTETAKTPGVGVVRDIVISNVIAHGSSQLCSSITGIPGHPVENVTLSNLTLISAGGGEAWNSQPAVPENEAKYPGPSVFGDKLPAYGLFIRHVRGIVLRNVSLRCEAGDERPGLVLDDVQKADLDPVP
jgi:polygalacturonase